LADAVQRSTRPVKITSLRFAETETQKDMSNGITLDQLKAVMIYALNHLNSKGASKIDENTKHEDVLSDTDGFGASNSKNIYQSYVQLGLVKHGHPHPEWPSDWMSLTVDELAPKLLG
jgi:hypothetical protein